jgi:cytochrome bd-type quinol oxidase subunit 2
MEINGLPLHPLVVHAVVVFVPLAAVTGLAYAELAQLSTVAHHQQAGLRLRWVMIGYTVVVLGAVWALGGPSALASGRGARVGKGRLELPAAILLALGGVAVLVAVFLAGDSGARSVWG